MDSQKITPFFWLDGTAEPAARFHTELFGGDIARLGRYTEAGTEIHGQQDGTVMVAEYDILGYRLALLNGGPHFRPSPAVSLFVQLPDRSEVERIWKGLTDGGEVLMPFDSYDWSPAYGWCNDRFGISWQISQDPEGRAAQPITPMLTFTRKVCGRAKEALEFYARVFPNSKVEFTFPYPDGAKEPAGSILHGQASLSGERVMAMDTGLDHPFGFDEGVSLTVNCSDQAEVDYFWEELVADGGSHSQCGWLKDRFGFSWQVVPRPVTDILAGSDRQAAARAMAAVMGMTRIDIATVELAAKGE